MTFMYIFVLLHILNGCTNSFTHPLGDQPRPPSEYAYAHQLGLGERCFKLPQRAWAGARKNVRTSTIKSGFIPFVQPNNAAENLSRLYSSRFHTADAAERDRDQRQRFHLSYVGSRRLKRWKHCTYHVLQRQPRIQLSCIHDVPCQVTQVYRPTVNVILSHRNGG